MAPLSLEAARELLLAGLQPPGPVMVQLAAAAGRILAAPVLAPGPFPPFRRSLVDGYALGAPAGAPSPGGTTASPGAGDPGAGQLGPVRLDRAAVPPGSTGSACPGEPGYGAGAGLVYRLVGTVAAGSRPEITLAPGTAAAIYTGARPPEGTVAVVPRELAEQRGEWLRVAGPPAAGQYLEPAGAEVAAGAEVLAAGTPLGPAEIGLLAALGIRELPVYRRPRVALAAIGSELLDLDGPGAVPAAVYSAAGPAPPGSAATGPGAGPAGYRPGTSALQANNPAGSTPPRIYNSNSYALAAAIETAGGRVIPLGPVADNLDAQARALQVALEGADLIVTTGGAGGSAFDFTATAFSRAGGNIVFTELKMRPGRRVIAARCGDKLMLGLPGNPPAALAVFYLLAAPVIRALGGKDPGLLTFPARLVCALEGLRPERTFIWALARAGSSGWEVTLRPRRPGGIRAATGANALIDLPPGAAPAAGEEVRVIMPD